MVSQQVLRNVAPLIAALAAPVAAHAEPSRGGLEPVALIDVRTPPADRTPRARAIRALRASHGLWPIDDRALAAALAGDPDDAVTHEADDAMATARRAYGALDCATTAAAANRAITALAAAQARGHAVTAPLVQAYTYQLLCSADDPARAHTAATRLRALGADPPAGVSSSVWARYPAVDATSNVQLVELAIDTDPGAATIWIDHRRAGAAPVVARVREGAHIIAAATDDAATAQPLILAGSARRQVHLAIPPPAPHRWAAVRRWTDGWRSGQRSPTPHDIHQLLATIGVRVAIVITTETARGDTRLEAWATIPARAETTAILLGSAPPDELDELVQIIRANITAWSRGELATTTATPVPPATPPPPDETKPWWVYATIAGAVLLGGGVMLANDLASDRQVIRLRYP